MPTEKPKAKDQIDYAIFNVVHAAFELAASASKGGRRLQPTAVEEYRDYVSNMVSRGMWSTDPVSGLPLSANGENISENFESWIAIRDGYWQPEAVSSSEEEVAAIWASGNRTLEAQRYKAIAAIPGVSAAGAMTMWNEEKAKYQSAGNDGKRTDKAGDAAALTTNPWSIRFNGDVAARDAKIAALLKMPSGGTRFCNDLAKAAGTTVGKPLGGTRHA
jgi:hypothetical protein